MSDGEEQADDLTENEDVTPLAEMRARTDRDAPSCPNCGSEDTVYVGGLTVDSICYACEETFLADFVAFSRACADLRDTILDTLGLPVPDEYPRVEREHDE